MLTKNIDLENKRILVTGAAGFIGSNLVTELLRRYKSISIIGIDNMSDYYDVGIKEDRLKRIDEVSEGRFELIRGSIADRELIDRIFAEHRPEVVVNLAAQAGVRYSIENPDAYIESNMLGFYILMMRVTGRTATRASFIWCMPPAPVYTAATRRFLTA